MIYFIALSLASVFTFLNIFKYITFRSGCALFTSFLLSLLIGGKLINYLKFLQKKGQPIRELGLESHSGGKRGTPTMGGILLLGSALISTLLWANLKNPYIWVVIFTIISFALIGAVDDYRKLKHNNTKGVSARYKFGLQIFLSLIITIIISNLSPVEISSSIAFPFFKNLLLDLHLFYFLFSIIVITGSSNAVNLTDGLDGLAIGPVIIVTVFFTILCYLTGNVIFSDYLKISYIPNSGELTVFCSALIGSGLGFLWFNAPPAKVFMGDIGSLALGAVIGVLAIITKHELILMITGGLFVIEAVSVILQVGSFKLRGKRIFKMAPIHHHFEKLGWSEPTIVIRFWIIAIIFALLGLFTLKIR